MREHVQAHILMNVGLMQPFDCGIMHPFLNFVQTLPGRNNRVIVTGAISEVDVHHTFDMHARILATIPSKNTSSRPFEDSQAHPQSPQED